MWRLLFTHHQHLGTGPLLKERLFLHDITKGRSPHTARSLARNALKRFSLFKLPVPLRLTQLLQLIALLSLRGLDLIELPLLCFVRRIRKCGPRFERKLALYAVALVPRNAGDKCDAKAA